jgi:hypothetical protein
VGAVLLYGSLLLFVCSELSLSVKVWVLNAPCAYCSSTTPAIPSPSAKT